MRFAIGSILLALTGAAFAAPSNAVVLARQDFEANTHARGIDNSADFGTAPGTFFDGTGLPWMATAIGPGPVSGIDSGDLIGVVDTSTVATAGNGSNDLSGAANATGNWFHVDDADNAIAIAFAPVDTHRMTGLALDFTWAAHAADYEPVENFFEVSVNGTSVFDVVGDDLETGPFVDSFAAQTLDLSAFTGQPLNITFTLATNSATEDLGFDNVVVSGTPVPFAPQVSAGLVAIATLWSLRALRRRLRAA